MDAATDAGGDAGDAARDGIADAPSEATTDAARDAGDASTFVPPTCDGVIGAGEYGSRTRRP